MPTEPYKEYRLKRLRDPKYAALLLKTSFEETLKDKNYEAFLLALKDVIEVHGSVKTIAEKAGISRQHLHLLLNGKGNPTLQTLSGILEALGLKIDFVEL